MWFVEGMEEGGAVELLPAGDGQHSATPPRWADQRVSGFPCWLPSEFINKTSQDPSGLGGSGHVGSSVSVW